MNSISRKSILAGILIAVAASPGIASQPFLFSEIAASSAQVASGALPGVEANWLSAPNAVGEVIRTVAQTNIATLFKWSAEKSADGIELTGSATNQAISNFLVVRAGAADADVQVLNQMVVSKNGPEEFPSNALAGLDALAQLVDGRVAYTGSKWTLSGHAATDDQATQIAATLGESVNASEWIVFLQVAPVAEPMAEASSVVESDAKTDADSSDMKVAMISGWSVLKSADGQIHMSGELPNVGLQNYLRVRAGEGASDQTTIGGAAPVEFVNTTIAAIDAVSRLQEGRIAYTGTKWTIGGFADTQETMDAVLQSLESVGVSDWVTFIQVAPQPVDEVEMAFTPDDLQFNAFKAEGGAIYLGGHVPSEAFANYAAVIAGGAPVDRMIAVGNAPDEFVNNAIAGIQALKLIEDGLLAYENERWALSGDALNDQDRDAATQLIKALDSAEQWQVEIGQVPLFQLCAMAVQRFSETHTILFAPASARLAEESSSSLRDLATELAKCPTADLHVAGHTDADGPAGANMALSVSRSEAVIAQLIEQDIAARRLYAIGYGETLPVAPNDTRAGKALNRRIVFELVPE